MAEDALAGRHVGGGEASDLDDDQQPPEGKFSQYVVLVPSLVMKIPFIIYDNVKAVDNRRFKTPLIGVISEYCVLRHFVASFT